MSKKGKKAAEESLDRIIEIQQAEHKKNQNRIKWGIRCVIIIPILFLILMFTMETSKYIYLTLWVASMFLISAYLIYVEYADYKIQETMIELGMKDDSIDNLLPENVVDARLMELSEKIAESQQSIGISLKELSKKIEETGLQELEMEELSKKKEKDSSKKKEKSKKKKAKKSKNEKKGKDEKKDKLKKKDKSKDKKNKKNKKNKKGEN